MLHGASRPPYSSHPLMSAMHLRFESEAHPCTVERSVTNNAK